MAARWNMPGMASLNHDQAIANPNTTTSMTVGQHQHIQGHRADENRRSHRKP
jgi:hypothetical protein